MNIAPKLLLRIQFLARVVNRESRCLATAGSHLFNGLFALEQVAHYNWICEMEG
jgi:hypothetical protein